MTRRLALAASALCLAASPALAHDLAVPGGGFGAGIAHPFLGTDHLLAMLAVGAFAAIEDGRAVWTVPLAFVLALVAGALLSMGGVHLPLVEPGILASCVVLGLLLIASKRLPVALGMGVVALFGLLHGHAHGLELPVAASPVLYMAGFTGASVILHVVGVGLGATAKRLPALRLAQVGGLAIAAFGVVGLVGL